jgi:hypothetical protein
MSNLTAIYYAKIIEEDQKYIKMGYPSVFGEPEGKEEDNGHNTERLAGEPAQPSVEALPRL